MKFLLATRSKGKLREIREILSRLGGIQLLDLDEAGVAPSAEEDGIEVFETFSENALAKARYFRRQTGMPTIADDSGLAVDALGGLPGVRSRRFVPDADRLSPDELDQANNRHLLERLVGVPPAKRTAHYVCVAALEHGTDEPVVFRGEARGEILERPRGSGGFGYDPLFLDPSDGQTFAELSRAEKDARSHRGAAFRALAAHLEAAAGILP
ncbi:MAG: RdgB/HAM1 family non-canonical purine NTP pyrophosphatase [Gemmatimonadetes bacterium]|nr:RdgB/HAM1 family non-canonical purine NTP pyrophosphatase [Gemmatimonadota bacterium]